MSTFSIDPQLVTVVTSVYLAHRAALIGQLGRSFPTTCPGRIEDAAQHAMLVALEYSHVGPTCVRSAWERGGRAALFQLLVNFGWRHLRGDHRRKANRVETPVRVVPEQPHLDHPEGLVQARRTLERVERLLPEAAYKHSKKHGVALTEALRDRLASGDTDKFVAERYGVERCLVCRARNWLQEQVEG